jgi:hypothetical protein
MKKNTKRERELERKVLRAEARTLASTATRQAQVHATLARRHAKVAAQFTRDAKRLRGARDPRREVISQVSSAWTKLLAQVAREHGAEAAGARSSSPRPKAKKKAPARSSSPKARRSSSSDRVAVAYQQMSEQDFAAEVKRLARLRSVAKFHRDRAFIASIYEHSRWAGHVPIDEFKTRLVIAHRAGRIRMTRADLVGAMDVDMVERSRTPYLSAEFHFVALD